MKRRTFTLLAGAAALPVAARAQQPKMLRVGAVSGQPRSSILWQAFVGRMTTLGYREGNNFSFDHVLANTIERYETGYHQIASGTVDVVVAPGPEVSLRSALATLPATVPIVMVAIDYDPLERGYVKSLARPGVRATGVFLQQIELAAKRVQLLKDSFPDIKAMTVFWDKTSADQFGATREAATGLGIRLAAVELVQPPYDYEKALAEAPADSRGTLLPMTSPFIYREPAKVAELALRQRAMLMWSDRIMTDAGGLMSYGVSFPAMFAPAADYIDRIAKGAKPSELPIEQPTKFELVLNLKTARAIGVTIPPLLLARADEVIE